MVRLAARNTIFAHRALQRGVSSLGDQRWLQLVPEQRAQLSRIRRGRSAQANSGSPPRYARFDFAPRAPGLSPCAYQRWADRNDGDEKRWKLRRARHRRDGPEQHDHDGNGERHKIACEVFPEAEPTGPARTACAMDLAV